MTESTILVRDGIRTMVTGFGWVYDDGGRHAAGFRGKTGDCVVRSIAIATGADYRSVYDDLHDRQRAFVARQRRKNRKSASPRDGVAMDVAKPHLAERGWVWTPTMTIGSGTTVHLRPGELPDDGPLIVRVTRHVTAIVDGLVRDTHDPCRGGMRAVYGYWQPARKAPTMRLCDQPGCDQPATDFVQVEAVNTGPKEWYGCDDHKARPRNSVAPMSTMES